MNAGDELLAVLEVAHRNLDRRDAERGLAAVGERFTPDATLTPTKILMREQRHLRAVP